MNHQDYVNMLKETVLKQTLETTLNIIFAKIPFLAWGPIGPLVSLAVKHVLKIAINQTEMAIYMKFIDMRVSNQGKAYNKAMEEHHRAQKEGTDEEKRIAEENLKSTFTNLIVLTN